jgi:hypothetical protein
MPARIVTRGVILRALEGNMRKSKKFWPVRSRIFRSLLVVAGVFLLTAAFAPKANAIVLIYFNFEDATIGGPFDPESDDVPPLGDNPGGGIQHSTITTNLVTTGAVAGFLQNRTAGDIDTADPGVALGMRTTPLDNGHWLQFSFDATAFSNMSLSFAINTQGNGFDHFQLSYSLDGVNFTNVGASTFIPSSGVHVFTITIPAAVDHQASVILRLTFTGGTSQGQDLETVIDNIQLTGVPEPATVGGGLLGVLGLCWHQRRRIRLILPRCGFRRLRRASV